MKLLNRLNSGVAWNRSELSGSRCSTAASLTRMGHLRFPGQFFVRETTANDVSHCEHEALKVGQVAVVVAERLFVDVPEQVEWLDGNIGSVEGPLQQRPEILQSVRMNVDRKSVV